MTRSRRKGAGAKQLTEAKIRTIRGRYFPEAGEITQLAAAAMTGESTVRRWYDRPDRTSFGNRHRLRMAATRLNIRHPDPAPANGVELPGDEP
jgi:hypothetical protein